MAAVEPIIVFFTLEISDSDMNSDILHIYMKRGTSEFNKYIKPNKDISEVASKITHLTVCDSKLYRDGEEKETQPIRDVLKDLLIFLKQFGQPCTLVGHRYCFNNAHRLVRAMKKENFHMKFNNVIAGFTDTVDIFADKFPGIDAKNLTVPKLAKEASVKGEKPYMKPKSSEDTVDLLEQISLHCFTPAELVAKRSFAQELKKLERLAAGPKKEPKKFVISDRTRKGDRFPHK